MKLIIDIPDYEYRQIKEVYEKNDNVENTYSYIYHGTPLDDVKSEIGKAQEPYITNTAYDEGVRFGLMLAYQIVDRCKESEDT